VTAPDLTRSQPQDQQEAEEGGLSRRQLLAGGTVGGLAALAGAGVIGYAWRGSPSPAKSQGTSSAASRVSPSAAAAGTHVYLSRPDLQPPVLSVAVSGTPAGIPAYVLLANKPYKGPAGIGQRGLLIAERSGEPMWFSPNSQGQVLDLNVQTYQGKPVLTWWHGETGGYYANGNCYIADSSYRQIAEVRAGNGLMADMHEFNLTSQGTALVDCYQPRKTDLTAVGGKARAVALSGVVQEIDIATGDVVFQWSSLDHVPVTETRTSLSGGFFGTGTAANPYDYFHVNSIAEAWDGDLLVSSRNTWTVYKIGRHDGAIKWRLGGSQSDFTLGPGVPFYWQHHVRSVGKNLITIFDNGSSPQQEPQSRGLLVRIDPEKMTATLERAYTNPARLLADNQGSMQLLPGNRAFVGWGAEPYFSEFDSDGSLLLNGSLPNGDQSYRAFTADWTGHPADKPALVVKTSQAKGVVAYVSWNGATEVAAWRLLAGKRAASLDVVATQPRAGFETMIGANTAGRYFAVAAYDSSGKQLGQSAVIRSA